MSRLGITLAQGTVLVIVPMLWLRSLRLCSRQAWDSKAVRPPEQGTFPCHSCGHESEGRRPPGCGGSRGKEVKGRCGGE